MALLASGGGSSAVCVCVWTNTAKWGKSVTAWTMTVSEVKGLKCNPTKLVRCFNHRFGWKQPDNGPIYIPSFRVIQQAVLTECVLLCWPKIDPTWWCTIRCISEHIVIIVVAVVGSAFIVLHIHPTVTSNTILVFVSNLFCFVRSFKLPRESPQQPKPSCNYLCFIWTNHGNFVPTLVAAAWHASASQIRTLLHVSHCLCVTMDSTPCLFVL